MDIIKLYIKLEVVPLKPFPVCKMSLYNLPLGTTHDDIANIFNTYGDVTILLIINPQNPENKAEIHFADVQKFCLAISECDNKMIRGRKIVWFDVENDFINQQ